MQPFFTTTENSRWMIVDDDEQLLVMIAAAIKDMTGAAVECYGSPKAALAAFRAAAGKYELVITDFEMPGMDGLELCRQLREISPAVEIFLATGSGFFTEEAAHHAGFGALLNKPFAASALRAAVINAGLAKQDKSLAA